MRKVNSMSRDSKPDDYTSLRDFLDSLRPAALDPIRDRSVVPFTIVPNIPSMEETADDALEHEFNNLIQVVKSAFNVIGRQPEISRSCEMIAVMRNGQQAADKAARLGHRLLASTRGQARSHTATETNDLVRRDTYSVDCPR